MWHHFTRNSSIQQIFIFNDDGSKNDGIFRLRPGSCLAVPVPGPLSAWPGWPPVPRVLLLHVAQGQGGRGVQRHQVHPDPRQHRPQHPGQHHGQTITCSRNYVDFSP